MHVSTMPRGKYKSPTPRREYTIMSAADVNVNEYRSAWDELEISGTVHNLCPEVWHFQHITILHLNDINLVRLPPYICQLVHLSYLDLSSNRLRSLPAELGDLQNLRVLQLNYNRFRFLPFELGRLFRLQTLGLTGNPLSQELLNIYNEPGGTHKLLTYMLDNLPVTTTAPPQRQWNVAAHPDTTCPSAIFSMMCYNVLCDKYCTRQKYGHCPGWALNWEYRKMGILNEIRALNGDIISLQEVETDQFFNFFLPQLQREGYDGIFSPKSRARTMREQERKRVDGCAIFFKKAKFTLLEEKLVELNQLAMANAAGSHDMLNRVMTKDNIGLAALLETKPPIFENGMPPQPHTRQLLLVCTVHLHWNPYFSDVKLVQTMMLMGELQRFVDEATRKYTLPFPGPYDCNSIPFLFCGDLNSLPDSGVIEFLTNGRVAVNHEDFKDKEYDHCMKKMSNGDKDHVYHNFRLARAYNDILPATYFTHNFTGIIDYIFYSRDHLNVLGMLGPYDEEWFWQNKILGCPNPHIPSDHFSLFVEMEMPIRLPPPGRGSPLPPLRQLR